MQILITAGEKDRDQETPRAVKLLRFLISTSEFQRSSYSRFSLTQ